MVMIFCSFITNAYLSAIGWLVQPLTAAACWIMQTMDVPHVSFPMKNFTPPRSEIYTSGGGLQQWWGLAAVGKPSAVGQPTRPTQPFILLDLVSGISYLRLCVYHRHLDSFKASWRQYFFARPTRHDSVRSWLLRLLELHLTNFPTYLLTYFSYLLYLSVYPQFN